MRISRLMGLVSCGLLLACANERPHFETPSRSSTGPSGSLDSFDAARGAADAAADDVKTKGDSGAKDNSTKEAMTRDRTSVSPSEDDENTSTSGAIDISSDEPNHATNSDAASVSNEDTSNEHSSYDNTPSTREHDSEVDAGPDSTEPIVSDAGGDTDANPGPQLGIGEACSDDDQCAQGTCQDSAQGGQICCTANCGDCKQCMATGDSCTDLVETRPGCECESDDVSNCNDGIPCTDDVCTNGQCENPVSSGSCLIAGQCVSQGTSEPNNPCRFCDSQELATGWSASSSQVSCDDDLWCNGIDSCNGSGACVHEYPSGNRCSLSGLCALSMCNEQRDSCFETEGTECSSSDELRCQNTSCGGDVQERTNVGYCDGQSASCPSAEPGTWVTKTNCGGSQTCDDETFTCVDTLGCGSTWCDTEESLCWTTSLATETMTLAEATTYCDDLVLAGRSNWRVPTSNELASSARACDGASGTLEDADFRSTCRTSPGDMGYTDCTACSTNGGPVDGCYWPTELGTCPSGDANYWSSTAMPSLPGVYYYYQFRISRFGAGSDTGEYYVRCVTDQ